MKKFLLLFFLSALSFASVAQTSYIAYLDSVEQIGTDTVTFKVTIKNTGTDTIALSSLAAGISFNYAGIANKGTVTVVYKTGSSSSLLPTGQRTPSVAFNSSSLQIQITVPATTRSLAHKFAPNAVFDVGRFYIKCTEDYVTNSHANLNWNFPSTSTSTFITTKVIVFVNRRTTITNLTAPISHYVMGNPILNPPGE